MFKKYLKNQKGLTLIELLAVIVILGIIAAIAIPAIGNVINNSRDKAAFAEAQQIIDAAKLYIAGENPQTYPITINKGLGADTADTNQLNGYLQKQPDKYKLVISKDTNTGELTFTLTNHAANSVGGDDADASLTEDEILQKLD
ncbi:prepilin-type N-terminal cleavage/methylation domain-containing protein [Ferdinandcohnia sp. Marseille-Q9671]